MNKLDKCILISLPKISDLRGNLTSIEGCVHIPFEMKRVYYLYDIPEKTTRGGHSHKNLQQIYIAVYGSFDVLLDDGKNKKNIHLCSPNVGLYIGDGIWRELKNFSQRSVCLVLASDFYDEEDYFRDYNEFLKNI